MPYGKQRNLNIWTESRKFGNKVALWVTFQEYFFCKFFTKNFLWEAEGDKEKEGEREKERGKNVFSEWKSCWKTWVKLKQNKLETERWQGIARENRKKKGDKRRGGGAELAKKKNETTWKLKEIYRKYETEAERIIERTTGSMGITKRNPVLWIQFL